MNDRKGNIVENQVSDFKDQLLDDKVKQTHRNWEWNYEDSRKSDSLPKIFSKEKAQAMDTNGSKQYNRLSPYFKEVSDWKDLKNLLEKSPTSRQKTVNFKAKENIWKLLTEE